MAGDSKSVDLTKALLTGAAAASLVLLTTGAVVAWNVSEQVQSKLRQERQDNRDWVKDRFVDRDSFAAFREEVIRTYATIRDIHKAAR